jgi:hypothetical protein
VIGKSSTGPEGEIEILSTVQYRKEFFIALQRNPSSSALREDPQLGFKYIVFKTSL